MVLVLAFVHEWAFYDVIGSQFRSLVSITDYFNSAIAWLPFAVVGLISALLWTLADPMRQIPTAIKDQYYQDHRVRWFFDKAPVQFLLWLLTAAGAFQLLFGDWYVRGAMERGALAPRERVPFFVHVDEFQTFSSDAFATLLSEARKFATHFCLVNQFTDQLPHSVRSAVLGNARSLVLFRVGSRDAELLAPEFHPMEPGALTDQEPFTAWLRRSDAGSDRITAEPKLYEPTGSGAAIKEQSRQRFGRPRRTIESRLYGERP
jgi:hypothetical protein